MAATRESRLYTALTTTTQPMRLPKRKRPERKRKKIREAMTKRY